MNNFFSKTISVLSQALNSIDTNEMESLIEDCLTTLHNGHKIICSGLGKNVPVCEKFVGTMTSLGLDACFMNTNSAIHGDIGLVHKGDLVIILTKSGETSESIYLHQLLNERECKQWLLTFEQFSSLAASIKDKVVIKLEHEGDKWNIVPNNSTTLNLIVLQTVAMQLADRLDITLNDFKRNHPGGNIGERLKNV